MTLPLLTSIKKLPVNRSLRFPGVAMVLWYNAFDEYSVQSFAFDGTIEYARYDDFSRIHVWRNDIAQPNLFHIPSYAQWSQVGRTLVTTDIPADVSFEPDVLHRSAVAFRRGGPYTPPEISNIFHHLYSTDQAHTIALLRRSARCGLDGTQH